MMSQDVCKASSTGHIGTLSNQQSSLSESLVHERLRSEQHRLNYERLRTLYEKLQNDMNTLTTTDETHGEGPVNQDDRGGGVSTTGGAEEGEEVPTELIKSLKRSSFIQKHCLGNPRQGTAPSTPLQTHVPLPTVLLSPASSTGLADDKGEDNILSVMMMGGPPNEIVRQCSRWKELYLNLLDEFQQYKFLNDVLVINNDQILAEKVREANQELDEIRVEQDGKLEKLRSRLDNVIRERNLLQTEIKAIREQLVETNGKLREKTILCETLQRQIDENSLSSHERRCEDPAHMELGNKLSAAEGRVLFLQNEVNEMSSSNNKLHDMIFSLIHESTHEITSLRKALSGNEEQVVKAQVDLQHQQDEAIQHLQVQQAYIEDLDKFVNERVVENNEVSQKVQDFATQVAQETEQTLQLLEDRLKKTTEEKVSLEESLVKASGVIRDLTEEAKKQRVMASRFITHIYQILSIPPGEHEGESPPHELCQLKSSASSKALPYMVLCDNIVNSINDDCELVHTFTLNTNVHMKELLKRVIFWSRQFELQKKRLRERVSQLEQFQMEQKKIALNDIDRYRKKCAFYREILRQLRNKLGIEAMDETLKNVLPPHVYEQARHWLSKHSKHHSRQQPQHEDEAEKDQPSNILPSVSSIDRLGQVVQLDPPEDVGGVSQAQYKFGPHSNTQTTMTLRPYGGGNSLRNYLRNHERFSEILDNVSKYLSQSDDFLND